MLIASYTGLCHQTYHTVTVSLSRAFDFESHWSLISVTPQDWGKQKCHSWMVNIRSEAVTSCEPGKNLPSGLGGCPGEVRVAGSLQGRVHWRQRFWEVLISVSCPGNCHFHIAPTPGPSQQPKCSSAVKPQAKQPTGWEHLLPTSKQTDCFKYV